MPYRPKRPCSFPGCPRLTAGRYCDEHQKLADQERQRYTRSPGDADRYGRDWRRISRCFLDDHPFCEMCRKEGRITEATIAHHVIPVKEGGTDDESNLMALCRPCHSRLHGERGDRWGRRKRSF
jgi:5-methylcytosine-specific restriction enzyme A